MELQHLPPELIRLILASIIEPESLLNLVTTCKTIYSLAATRLEVHRKEVQRYSYIGICSERDIRLPRTEFDSAIKLLSELQNEPRAAHYVRDLAFGPINLDDIEQTRHSFDTDRCVESCAWIHTASERDAWKDELGTDGGISEISACIFLMGFLPNLTTVDIQGIESPIRVQVDRLTASLSFNTASDLARTIAHENLVVEPLGNLRCLHVQHWDTEGGESIYSFRPLLFIPSLKRFSGHMISNYPHGDLGLEVQLKRLRQIDEEAKKSHHQPFVSSVESIELTFSAISPLEMFLLVRQMPYLRTLDYEYAGTDVDGWLCLSEEEGMEDDDSEDATAWSKQFAVIARDWLVEKNLVVIYERNDVWQVWFRKRTKEDLEDIVWTKGVEKLTHDMKDDLVYDRRPEKVVKSQTQLCTSVDMSRYGIVFQ